MNGVHPQFKGMVEAMFPILNKAEYGRIKQTLCSSVCIISHSFCGGRGERRSTMGPQGQTLRRSQSCEGSNEGVCTEHSVGEDKR